MMIQRLRLLVLPLLGFALVNQSTAADAPTLAALHGPVVLWEHATHGYNIFKVPTLITNREGDVLLAICEARVESRADDAETRLVQRRSTDGGRTWSPMTVVHREDRRTVGNPAPVLDRQTGIIPYRQKSGKLAHVYVSPSVSARGRMDKSARRDVSLWISTDGCAHWRKLERLWEGPSAYSDLAILRDGTLGVIFEAGKERYDDQIVLRTFRLPEL